MLIELYLLAVFTIRCCFPTLSKALSTKNKMLLASVKVVLFINLFLYILDVCVKKSRTVPSG